MGKKKAIRKVLSSKSGKRRVHFAENYVVFPNEIRKMEVSTNSHPCERSSSPSQVAVGSAIEASTDNVFTTSVEPETHAENKLNSYEEEIVSGSGSNDENKKAPEKEYKVHEDLGRIVKEDETEEDLEKIISQLLGEDFEVNLNERNDDVSRGDNNVKGQETTVGPTYHNSTVKVNTAVNDVTKSLQDGGHLSDHEIDYRLRSSQKLHSIQSTISYEETMDKALHNMKKETFKDDREVVNQENNERT